MLFSIKFHAKIVNNYGEIDWSDVIFHRYGVFFVGWYPYGARCLKIVSCVFTPYFHSLYMPLINLENMYSLCNIYLRL